MHKISRAMLLNILDHKNIKNVSLMSILSLIEMSNVNLDKMTMTIDDFSIYSLYKHMIDKGLDYKKSKKSIYRAVRSLEKMGYILYSKHARTLYFRKDFIFGYIKKTKLEEHFINTNFEPIQDILFNTEFGHKEVEVLSGGLTPLKPFLFTNEFKNLTLQEKKLVLTSTYRLDSRSAGQKVKLKIDDNLVKRTKLKTKSLVKKAFYGLKSMFDVEIFSNVGLFISYNTFSSSKPKIQNNKKVSDSLFFKVSRELKRSELKLTDEQVTDICIAISKNRCASNNTLIQSLVFALRTLDLSSVINLQAYAYKTLQNIKLNINPLEQAPAIFSF